MPRAINIEENYVSRKKRSRARELVDVPTRASSAESWIVAENPLPPEDTDYYLPSVQDYPQLISVRLHTLPSETAHVKVYRLDHDGYEILNIEDETPLAEEIYADARPLPQIVYNGVTYCPMMAQSLQFYQESVPIYDQFPDSEKYENGAADNFLDPLDPASIDIFGVNQVEQVQSPFEIKRIQRSNKNKCINCKTDKTSLWRRNDEGYPECNACNLYYHKNRVARPPQLFNDTIKRRRSKPRIFFQ
ncbi:GATA zinc finger domain-containing protein [Ditylenchus destructor]|nr:GATA zinc finger domain-containing protein [Ditylenchus destructor]